MLTRNSGVHSQPPVTSSSSSSCTRPLEGGTEESPTPLSSLFISVYLYSRDVTLSHDERKTQLMGSVHSPTCQSCGHHWENELIGGLMSVGQYRCDACGKGQMVSAEEVVDADLPGDASPWTLTADQVRALVGSCFCGGTFDADAPARCPRCNSTEIDLGPPEIMVD